MNILLVGSSGFIGSHLGVRLSSFVHVIPCGRKNLEDCTPFAIADYRITNSEEWQKILIHHNIDVVINSVGIIRETPQQKFRELHEIGPIELFKACAAASQVSKQIRIIQISALGADEKSTSQYHKSKKAADDFLWQLSLPKVIIYPSLVFGKNGESAKLFESIASLPFLVVPNHGRQQIQPIYIDDLAHLVASLIHTFPIQPLRILAVGSAPLTLNEFLQFLRKALNLPRALSLSIPYFIMKRIARWGKLY